MNADKYITVWLDETSEGAQNAAWIVDKCDADGNSITVGTFEDEGDAQKFAAELSEKTGLPVRA